MTDIIQYTKGIGSTSKIARQLLDANLKGANGTINLPNAIADAYNAYDGSDFVNSLFEYGGLLHDVEFEDIEAQKELEKFLESKLTNLNIEDSVTVIVTKILKLMSFQNKENKEIIRKFLTLVIRPRKFSLDKILNKLSSEFNSTVFEIRIMLSEIINNMIQINKDYTLSDFCIVIRKIANSSIREKERER